MNYGRFFVLDHGASRLDKGISVFKYRELKDDLADGKQTHSYPVYLTITSESIDFRVHYTWAKCNNGSKGTQGHLHNTILSLPLSANFEVKDQLSSALASVYKTIFPGQGERLHELIETNIADYSGFVKVCPVSYSNLPQFGITEELYSLKKLGKDNIREADFDWFIRKLVLDFLFDLEHTRVFQNSPYYELISTKLRENYFLNALANKANYYYYRKLAEKSFAENKGKTDGKELDKTLFYGGYVLKAEREWTKSIWDQRSDTVFHESGKWFGTPEDELRGVYSRKKKKEDKEITQFHTWGEKDSYLLIIPKGSDKSKDTYQDKERQIRDNNNQSSKWYVRRCAFNNLFTAGENVMLCVLMGLLLLGAVADLFFHFADGVKLGVSGSILFLFFIFAGLFARKKLFFGSHIYYPRLLIAIITGWITIFFGTTMFSAMDRITSNSCIVIVSIGVLLAVVAWFLYSEIGRLNPYINSQRRLGRTAYLMLLSFLYSFTVGQLLYMLTEKKAASGMDMNYTMSEFKDHVHMSISWQSHEIHSGEGLNYLMLTFFAMFIGLFLNTMILEKRATEPL